jgi:endonuclease/exonuclease/phosphatase (EEP) superfamily protein YafD
MNKRIIFVLILVILMISLGGKLRLLQFQENVKEVGWFFRTLVYPVYDYTESEMETQSANSVNQVMKFPLEIVSWNAYRGYSFEKFENSLNEIDKEFKPGIILLQEATINENFMLWEKFTDFNWLYVPFHTVETQSPLYPFASSGQTILSKYKFVESKAYQLPTVTNFVVGKGHKTQRVMNYAKLENGVGVYNAHLENAAGPGARKKQIESILRIIEKNSDEIVILAGDFNFFLGPFESGLSLLKKEGFIPLQKGFFQLDYIFVKGAEGTGEYLQGKGSDHNPIFGSIKLNIIN